ncbi:MAG: tetratricopeptide repeat protein, partial [Myxococcales bacterium]|nr:tetratricopeptide repeat protein [Myxococcales bacterium]
EEHPDTLTVLSLLGQLFSEQGRHDEALVLEQIVVDGRRELLPEGHPSTFQERFGDFGFDLSPYESVQIELTLELTDDGGTGRIALLGGIDDCQNLDPSAGCGPLRDELLFERTFELAR